MLGFFSFTEVTDPTQHGAYNEWHQLDHLPQQFSLDGLHFGQRWVCTPACRRAMVAVSPVLEPCQYVTLYLLRDEGVLPGFFALGQQMWDEDRFFQARRAPLTGPFEVVEQLADPRVKVSPDVVPFRPARGIYVVVGPPVPCAAMVAHRGVAGAWQFADGQSDRHITVAFIDGDLPAVAGALGDWCLGTGRPMEWAGPLETIDAYRWDWFAKLTPQ